MIILVLVAVVSTTVLSFLQAPVYKAYGQVYVRRGVTGTVAVQNSQAPGMHLFNLDEEIFSQMAIVRSRDVLLSAMRTYENECNSRNIDPWPLGISDRIRKLLGSKPLLQSTEAKLEHLQKNMLMVEHIRKSDIIRIGFETRHPSVAAAVANAAMHAYITKHLSLVADSLADEFYTEQIEAARVQLKQLEEVMKDFQDNNNLVDVDKQQNTIMDMKADAEIKRMALAQELIAQQAKVKKLQAFRRKNPDNYLPFLNPGNQALVSQFQQRLAELKFKRIEYLHTFKQNHPKIAIIDREIESLHKEIESEIDRVMQYEKMILLPLRTRLEAFDKEIQNYQNIISSLPGNKLAYRRFQQQLRDYRDIISLLERKRSEAVIREATDDRVATVKVLSPAVEPANQAYPNRPLNILLSLFSSMILALLAAFLKERLDTTFRIVEHVESQLDLPLLTTLPDQEPVDHQQMLSKWIQNPPNDGIRMINHPNLLLEPFGTHGSFLVTSAVGKEGVTTTSVLLASLLAIKRGANTLYIDGNVSKPHGQAIFDTGTNKKLLDLHTEEFSLKTAISEGAVYRTDYSENLWVCKLNTTATPLQPFNQIHFKALLKEAKSIFQYVVLDAPATMLCLHHLPVARHFDGAIIVIRAEKTRWEVVQKTQQLLLDAGARLVGVVLNRRRFIIPAWLYRRLF